MAVQDQTGSSAMAIKNQTSESILHINELGFPVKLVRSPRVKRINLSIRPFEGVRVAAPSRVSKAKISEILMEKKEWIEKHLVKTKAVEKKSEFDENSTFRTREHTLKMEAGAFADISVRVSRGFIHVTYPALLPVDDRAIQEAARKGIEKALRKEARKHLLKRVEELAQKFGFSYSRVALKNAKTRWGSCSRQGNINLNIHLMRLPARLTDYVILHELCHTVEANHGKGFWAKMESVLPGARQLDKELNTYWIRH